MRTRYQLGTLKLRRRKNGPAVWQYRWRERIQNGKFVRRGLTIGTLDQYPSKTLAMKACGRMLLSINSENPLGQPISFGTLIARYEADELPVRHSTSLAYRSYLDTHIKPRWADYPLSKMVARGAPFMIEEWFKTLPLAPKTKGNIRNVMAVMFNCAMRWGLIDIGANPMHLVRVKGISKRLEEPRVLSAEECQRLIAAFNEEPYRTLVILDLATGLRCSELLGLKWLDIDWEDLTLLVRRAIVDGVVDDVKTKYSRSGLPLDPALAELLLQWKRQSRFSGPEDWVFASWRTNGVLPFRSTAILTDYIKPAAIRAGLGDGVGWHTFRHTYSSLLRANGEDLKVQQELLRHADIRTTMNVYTQAVSEQKRQAHAKVVRMVVPSGAGLDAIGRRQNA